MTREAEEKELVVAHTLVVSWQYLLLGGCIAHGRPAIAKAHQEVCGDTEPGPQMNLSP